MTEARYADINAAGTVAVSDRFSEILTYDVRGNIKTLQRYGLNSATCTYGLIDNLTYQYDPSISAYNPSNKLYKVTDASNLTRGFKTVSNGSLYSYDVDGNMTADPNKGITNIVYNHLNLPTSITFTGSKTITFLYDAGGNKLRKTVVNNGVTQYVQNYAGGIEYRNNVLESIFHSEGRVTKIDNTFKYEYAIKDHLGNTRIMFSDRDNNGVVMQRAETLTNEVTQENHYYAFGMNMDIGSAINISSIVDNRYQYNGKELNEDFGLNWNDYGARFYDAAIGRWNVVDHMAVVYEAYSPYAYVLNNPIRLIDPNGMYSADPTASKNTSVLAQDGSKVGGSGSTISTSDKKDNGSSTNGRVKSESSNNLSICPTCDKDNPDHKPYIDDPNNLYTYLDGIIVNGDGSGAVITAPKVDLIGAAWQTADDYDTFFHNHDTYKTTTNEVRTIRKPNGKVRSARALKYARLSGAVKVLGPLGDLYTIYSVSQEENPDNWAYLDGAVAVVSIVATAAAVIVSAPVVATAATVVGVAGAVYGTARLGYSIYENIK